MEQHVDCNALKAGNRIRVPWPHHPKEGTIVVASALFVLMEDDDDPHELFVKWDGGIGFLSLDLLEADVALNQVQIELTACCADPHIRGGSCLNCGTWLETGAGLSQHDNGG